ncbi:MAG: thiamine-phosphate kinase [Fimbriimonadaceae bacterium]
MSDLLRPDEVPQWIRSRLNTVPRQPHVHASVDEDDCATIRTPGPFTVVTTDFINSSPALLELNIGGYEDLGRLVVRHNLSDLAGTGAKPVSFLLGACMPRDASRADFEDLFSGALSEAEKYGVPIVGGDTKLGSKRAIYGVAVGSVQHEDELMLRTNARPGDQVWCSGELGGFAASVLALAQGASVSVDLQEWALARILSGSVPLEKSGLVASLRLRAAGTDISDGLWDDAQDICDSSEVAMEIETEKIPIEPKAAAIAAALGIQPWTLAIASGGDFQFLCATRSENSHNMLALGMHRIGCIVARGESKLILGNRCAVSIPRVGHQDCRAVSFKEEIMATARALSTI